MSAALVKAPTRGELEALTLKERVALEDVLGAAQAIVRELNDAEIARLHEAGASQRAIAEACGRSPSWVRTRLGCLSPSEAARLNNQPVPQNGDGPIADAEVVEPTEVLDPEPPVGHLPDFVASDADTNLRTVSLRWFQWGRDVKALLDEGGTVAVESRDDKRAIRAQADLMVKVARALKGAL